MAYDLPVDQCRVRMVFEDRFDVRIKRRVLRSIAHEVAYHTDIVSLGDYHDGNQIRTSLAERGMDGVPGSNPAIEAAAARQFGPSQIYRVAFVANRLRTPLER